MKNCERAIDIQYEIAVDEALCLDQRGLDIELKSVSALYLLCSLMLHVRQFLCHWPVSTKKMA